MRYWLLGILFGCLGACASSKKYQISTKHFEESLFVLGVFASAAADVSEDSDMKPYYFLTGKNEDWDSRFPLRKVVRDEVQTWPTETKQALLNQFKSYPAYWSIYSAFFLETLSEPPHFRHTNFGASTRGTPLFSPLFEARKSWEVLAAQIYKKQSLAKLWQDNKQLWELSQPSASRVHEIKKSVIEYLRMDQAFEASLPDYQVVVNPLMSSNNGGNIFPMPNKVVLVIGPSSLEKIEVLVAHEFMHLPVNRLIIDVGRSDQTRVAFKTEALQKAFDDSECAMTKVKQNWGYVDWWNYSTEALIRAASERMFEVGNVQLSNFKYQNEFATMLESYENNKDESFVEFLIRALSELRDVHCL